MAAGDRAIVVRSLANDVRWQPCSVASAGSHLVREVRRLLRAVNETSRIVTLFR